MINKAITFLATQQQKDGSFLSYSTSSKRSFKNAKRYHSTFPSSLILSCLCSLDETPAIKLVKDKLAKFLLFQKSKHWSFNYWVRHSKESKKLPYPDDLDDTFCALSALYQYDPNLIDGAAMAKIVTLLTAVEEKEGGPYRTWLVPETADKVWKDVNLAVNSNIAYFLSLQDVSLPKLNSFIESAIDTDRYLSPYYPSVYPIIYFISRDSALSVNSASQCRNFLFSKQDTSGKWTNPLNTALAVLSLLNFGVPPNKLDKSIVYITKKQNNGFWQPHAFCLDPAINRKKYYAGSAALTTAFCLEAISKYDKLKSQNSNLKTTTHNSKLKDEGKRI